MSSAGNDHKNEEDNIYNRDSLSPAEDAGTRKKMKMTEEEK